MSSNTRNIIDIFEILFIAYTHGIFEMGYKNKWTHDYFQNFIHCLYTNEIFEMRYKNKWKHDYGLLLVEILF